MSDSNQIHPTAILADTVKLGEGVKIGPYSVIGENVTIGDGAEIASHVSIQCRTIIGKNVKIFPFVSIDISQDLKYEGEDSSVEIGDNTVIREYVTINNGSHYDKNTTIVGKNCLLMIGTHIAHDCVIGNNVIIANNTVLGGHVTVEDNVVIGGMAAVHPKVKIGRNAIIGGMSGIANDVIPYGNAKNDRAYLDGLNIIGMKRSGMSRNQMQEMTKFFAELFDEVEGNFLDRIAVMKEKYSDNENIQYIISFIKNSSNRSICMPKTKKEG